MRDDLLRNPVNQILFNVAPLTDETFRSALEHDDAYSVAFALKRDQLIDFISREYHLPVDIVSRVADYDFSTWKGALSSGTAARFEPLRVRTKSRLLVFQKNRLVLEKLQEIVPHGKEGFLDVGCGHGFTMLAASSQGYKVAHGIEVDPGFFRLGKLFFPSGLEGDLGYAATDFLLTELLRKYSLITFFDVLEHVADFHVAMRKSLESLTEDGIIYLYQGNARSVQMARVEPHYRVPMLTLLPRELAIEILLRLRKISDPHSYCVCKWPPIDFFNRSDCEVRLISGPENFRGGDTYMALPHATNALKALRREYLASFAPILSVAEMSIVDDCYAKFVSDFEHASRESPTFDRDYLMSSWNLIIRKTFHEALAAPCFQKLSAAAT